MNLLEKHWAPAAAGVTKHDTTEATNKNLYKGLFPILRNNKGIIIHIGHIKPPTGVTEGKKPNRFKCKKCAITSRLTPWCPPMFC